MIFKSSKIAFTFIIKEDLNNYEMLREIFANNSENLLFYKANALLNFDLLKIQMLILLLKRRFRKQKQWSRVNSSNKYF